MQWPEHHLVKTFHPMKTIPSLLAALRRAPSRMWRAINATASILLVVLMAGCETARDYSLTYKVWDAAQRPSNRPAPDPKFALFVSRTNNELLVVYDALSERRE